MAFPEQMQTQEAVATNNAGSEVQAAPVEKKRYEWIDNARLLAALFIICMHMCQAFPDNPAATCDTAKYLAYGSTLYGQVPYFFVLAGYFLGRRITWHKAFDRALWLFVPFLLWNVIVYAIQNPQNLSWETVRHLPQLLGIGCIFDKKMHMFGLPMSVPVINVTWFLRDIIVLSLLTPILVRFKLVVLALLLVVVSYVNLSFQPDATVLMTPYACFYYMLGICLSNCKISDACRIFNKKLTVVFVITLAAVVANCLWHGLKAHPMGNPTLVGGLFGAMLIAYCGVLLERHLPRFSKCLAPCGPACFLVFVLHLPVLQLAARYLPECITGTWAAWLLPIPTCAVIIFVFLMMKRFTPWLMPYLGHMKVAKKPAA